MKQVGIYLNSRYYNPKLARFVTMDEIDYLGASGSVLSYNLYSYCENNPINNIDSNGNSLTALSWATVASTVWSAKSALAAIGAISRAALIVFAAIVATMLVTYAIGNAMNKTVDKAIAEGKTHINGKHTVYVLVANGGSIGSGVFYVGRTKNFTARYSAHKANPEKVAAGGNFLMVPVYTGLDAVSAKALEQGLMNAYSTHILINKIRGISRKKIKPKYWIEDID
jgi:RHS repeat-associated protein